MIILVCGLPGSGKTRVAREISKMLNICFLNSDKIRKKILLKPKYTKSEKQLIYKIMFLLAEEFVSNKMSVILDAVFHWKSVRKMVKKIAKQNQTTFKIIEVRCRERTLLERIDRRIKKGGLSDADKKVYFKIKKQLEPIGEKHFIIDNSKSFKHTKAQLKTILEGCERNLKPGRNIF